MASFILIPHGSSQWTANHQIYYLRASQGPNREDCSASNIILDSDGFTVAYSTLSSTAVAMQSMNSVCYATGDRQQHAKA